MQPNVPKKNNLIPIIVVVVILGAIGYFYMQSRGGDAPLLAADTPTSDTIIGRDLLVALKRLSVVKLDDSLFNDPLFQSLQDFTVELLPQPVGRENPFAAFSRSGAVSTSTASLKKSVPKKH